MPARRKSPATPVPQSRPEFEAAAVELAEMMRDVSRINDQALAEIARIKLAAKDNAAAYEARAEALWKGIGAYAEAHRTELLTADRKSLRLAAGTLGWRISPPKVGLPRNTDSLIAWLQTHDDGAFLRTKVEIDKAAMLVDPVRASAIPGVTIDQAEELFFKPDDLEEERTRRLKAEAA